MRQKDIETNGIQYQAVCGYEQYNDYQALLSAFSGDEDIITRRCLEVIIGSTDVKLGNLIVLSSYNVKLSVPTFLILTGHAI